MDSQLVEIKARAPDIVCEGCASAIERVLGGLDGIFTVRVDVAAQEVTVEADEERVTPALLLESLSSAGYESELLE